MKCRVCKKTDATLPEGSKEPRFCSKCWNTRLRQLFQEEDRFRVQRVMRTSDAEKHLIYHDDHEGGATAVGLAFALLDRAHDQLEVSAFLSNRFDWHASVPFIYEEGVECEVEILDVFLGIMENDLVAGWRPCGWSAEITLCTDEIFWIDSSDSNAEEGGGDDAPA
ncbi:MAG: hypothetical protein EXS14_10050 [Planctomycetes bacterium]|nr:hypothetical protein [Planctomycetota bacterium]